ncbi:MAG: VCBS repeat-containing protein [Candidatus Tectomicrobia bacterium]|nr:VCBS repeat-containing protein [Candidatus Tectomicrobia bacterium]
MMRQIRNLNPPIPTFPRKGGRRDSPLPLDGGGRGWRYDPLPLDGGERGWRYDPLPLDGGGRGWGWCGVLALFMVIFFLKSATSQSVVPSFTVKNYPAGDNPFQLQVADFDKDGNVDFAVVNRSSHDVTIFLLTRDGKGGMKVDRWNYKTGKNPVALFAADLNGDGKIDFVTANLGENTITTLINKGKIEEYGILDLVKGKSYPLGDAPYAIWGGDFDGDGDIDLAVAVENLSVTQNLGRVVIFKNDGKGEFQLQTSCEVGMEPRTIIGVDINGDGAIDLITTNKGGGTASILFNDGKGNFPNVTSFEAGDSPNGLWAGDLDGDGDIDLAVTNISSNTITILKNQGKGILGKGISYPVQAQFPFALVGIDIDKDGDIDLITANLVGDNISLLLNRGDGSFEFFQSYPAGNGPRSIAAGDFNGDGLLDLVVSNRFSDDVSLFLQQP